MPFICLSQGMPPFYAGQPIGNMHQTFMPGGMSGPFPHLGPGATPVGLDNRRMPPMAINGHIPIPRSSLPLHGVPQDYNKYAPVWEGMPSNQGLHGHLGGGHHNNQLHYQ